MGWFNLDSDTQDRIDAMPGTTEVPPAGALEGLATAIPKGIASGVAKVENLGLDSGFFNESGQLDFGASKIVSAFSPDYAQATAEEKEATQAALKVVTDWAATGQDPRVTGVAGRIASTTSEGITIGAAGSVAGPWGAAALLGSTEGYGQYKDATAQGVDADTAKSEAVLTGLFSAAGAVLPMQFGKSLATSLLGGAAMNVGLGGLQRHLTSDVLEAGGYHDMAAQYRIADGEAVASDLILGAAFGAFGHATSRQVNPADVDAAAAVATEDHFNRSAPGVPTDPQTATLHADTMASALRSLADGDLPDIPPERAQQLVDNVLSDPMHEQAADLHEAAQAELPGFESAAADIKPIEMPPEEVPPPKVEPEPVANPDVLLDTFHQELLDHLVHNYGDERYTTEDGRDVSYRELAEEMQTQRNEIELFSQLHEVAGACAARNGTNAAMLPTIDLRYRYDYLRHFND